MIINWRKKKVWYLSSQQTQVHEPNFLAVGWMVLSKAEMLEEWREKHVTCIWVFISADCWPKWSLGQYSKSWKQQLFLLKFSKMEKWGDTYIKKKKRKRRKKNGELIRIINNEKWFMLREMMKLLPKYYYYYFFSLQSATTGFYNHIG